MPQTSLEQLVIEIRKAVGSKEFEQGRVSRVLEFLNQNSHLFEEVYGSNVGIDMLLAIFKHSLQTPELRSPFVEFWLGPLAFLKENLVKALVKVIETELKDHSSITCASLAQHVCLILITVPEDCKDVLKTLVKTRRNNDESELLLQRILLLNSQEFSMLRYPKNTRFLPSKMASFFLEVLATGCKLRDLAIYAPWVEEEQVTEFQKSGLHDNVIDSYLHSVTALLYSSSLNPLDVTSDLLGLQDQTSLLSDAEDILKDCCPKVMKEIVTRSYQLSMDFGFEYALCFQWVLDHHSSEKVNFGPINIETEASIHTLKAVGQNNYKELVTAISSEFFSGQDTRPQTCLKIAALEPTPSANDVHTLLRVIQEWKQRHPEDFQLDR